MAQVTLVLLEVTGIQDYVFGSNQLGQNIGASELVYRVTTQWVRQAINLLRHNEVIWTREHELTWRPIGLDEDGLVSSYDVVLVYAAAGNAMLLFADKEKAHAFIKQLSGRVLRQARGLQLVAAYEEFSWRDIALAQGHEDLRGKLALRKTNRVFSSPLDGLGITASCAFTGLPSIGLDNDLQIVGEDAARKAEIIGSVGKPISGEVADKLRAEHEGKKRLKALLKGQMPETFDFVYDFGEFGTPGESSYIAVIHADGNGMGERFGKLKDKYNSATQNQAYVQALGEFSDSIKNKATEALRKTVDYLLTCFDGEYFCQDIRLPRRRKDRTPLLPFRPIVFGGDDVTFISDGRLGLALAAKYLEYLSTGDLVDGKPLHARAGVAVVKSHYPFARAYDMATGLEKSAKKQIKALKVDDTEEVTVLDWHFATSGTVFSLKEIRGREYSSHQGHSLLMRPLRLSPIPKAKATSQWRTWETFTNLMLQFQKDETWAGHRNKLKALRDALRGGPTAVQLFRTNYDLQTLPDITGQPDMSHYGWQGNECGYFDAVEAIDLFKPLQPVPTKEQSG